MNVIFDTVCKNNDLRVYIHCFSAVDYGKVSRRLHTHSEYDTNWSEKLSDWEQKGYFKNLITEELTSNGDTVMFVLTFTEKNGGQDFIKDLNTYLHDGHFNYGAYFVQYKSHTE